MSRRRKTNNTPTTSQDVTKLRWFKADLHLHTPASGDYEEPKVTYLEWLRQASEKELDIIAITDHNTVAGVAAVRQEIEWLAKLEEQNRLTDDEKKRLDEWRTLANKILVLPGFEFTATFGFHILGIFPPETSIRHLEYVLLNLNVPAEKLDQGSTETGASTDVLTAYQVITEAGGLAIAAHANSTHGVAMRNFPFGGQTKIAYTQNENLIALEVTDLESRSRNATARFFNGSKPEYARKMHCLQGSDAHRLISDPKNPKRLGIGERATELLLPEASFEAIADLLASTDFDRTRAYRPKDKPIDHLAVARAEGPNQVQSFHETVTVRGGRQAAVLADLCAFANTDGGVVYVGASVRKGAVKGLTNIKGVQKELQAAIAERLQPQLEVRFETAQSDSAQVLRVSVDEGDEKPYCLDQSKFYVRNDAETSLAVRDEIVALVLENAGINRSTPAPQSKDTGNGNEASTNGSTSSRRRRGRNTSRNSSSASTTSTAADSAESSDPFYLPQVGVEIVSSENRNGVNYYVVSDLRNERSVSNVTRKGARKLWNYAIAQVEDHPAELGKIQWKGDVGLVRSESRAGKIRYDLARRKGKEMRIFYGVTEDGMEGPWAEFVKK
ncbi:MAG: RNA-binding domain-containing protein [Caldilineaceae bacterium]